MKNLISLSLFALLILTLSSSAFADSFVHVPGGAKNIELKVVRYDGGTNGAMVVQVKNSGTKPLLFETSGLFFVPFQTPNEAPQRLGASGPFTEILGKAKTLHSAQVSLKGGETKLLRLEVFCIDSHRASPTSKTKFSLATKKLPKALRNDIKKTNTTIYKHHKGDPNKAKDAIQSNMWKQRNKKWIKLQGEGVQEKDL